MGWEIYEIKTMYYDWFILDNFELLKLLKIFFHHFLKSSKSIRSIAKKILIFIFFWNNAWALCSSGFQTLTSIWITCVWGLGIYIFIKHSRWQQVLEPHLRNIDLEWDNVWINISTNTQYTFVPSVTSSFPMRI